MGEINLLPREIIERRRRRLDRIFRTASVVLLLGLGAYYYVNLYLLADSYRQQIAREKELYARYEQIKEVETHLKSLRELVPARERYFANVVKDNAYSEALVALARATPKRITLVSLQLTGGGASVLVNGKSLFLSDVAQFIIELERTGKFKAVRVVFPGEFEKLLEEEGVEPGKPNRLMDFTLSATMSHVSSQSLEAQTSSEAQSESGPGKQ